MRIDQLLLTRQPMGRDALLPDMDPLTEADALQEAQVLDVQVNTLTSVVGIVFELRQALQLREGNTGVLIARGVRELTWSAPPRDTTLTAWSVGSSAPTTKDGDFFLDLIIWPHPGARLSLQAQSAEFYVGDVPGLPETPTDYTKADGVGLLNNVATWGSNLELKVASFLDLTVGGEGLN
jgi:hypothetical protein